MINPRTPVPSQAANITNQTITSGNDTLKLMLDALNSYVKEFMAHIDHEVTLGKEMLAVDMDTEFTAGVKQSIENPISSLINGTLRMDEIIMERINEVVERFLRTNSSLLAGAFRLSQTESHLNYLLVLNEDSPENRDALFAIQYHFEDGFDPKYSIKIHFIPKESLPLVRSGIEINLQ